MSLSEKLREESKKRRERWKYALVECDVVDAAADRIDELEREVAALRLQHSSAFSSEPRTAKDYAIEHAGYLAISAASFLQACNALHELQGIDEDERGDPAEYNAREERALETYSEAWRDLREGIYEFEKRRDRALAPHRAGGDFAVFVRFNGERQRWTTPVITYAQAVANCTRGHAHPQDIYTVSYSTPSGRDGTLRPGQETQVEEGMSIDAGITGRA